MNKKIISQFPVLSRKVHGKKIVYLDSAATTLKPQAVIDAVALHYEKETANVHRGVHYLSMIATEKYEDARRKLQEFIHADKVHEVIFTSGATESVNLVANSYAVNQLNKGDIILVSAMEHHSNIVPWQMAAEKTGAVVKPIPLTEKGELDLNIFKKLLEERVKLVAFNHISNALGTVNPVKKLTEMAHKAGARVLIDAAQSMIHDYVNVTDLDCDFLVLSGHKMLGPTGVGVLYGKESLLDKMPPWQGGGDMIRQVTFEKTTYAELPEKFEAGTPPIAQAIGLGSAVDYIQGVGLETIMNHERELTEYTLKKLSETKGLTLIGKADNRCSLFSFVLDGVHPHDAGTFLDEDGIAVRTGHHCAQPVMDFYGIPATTRASFSFYNTYEDTDRLIESLTKIREFFI